MRGGQRQYGAALLRWRVGLAKHFCSTCYGVFWGCAFLLMSWKTKNKTVNELWFIAPHWRCQYLKCTHFKYCTYKYPENPENCTCDIAASSGWLSRLVPPLNVSKPDSTNCQFSLSARSMSRRYFISSLFCSLQSLFVRHAWGVLDGTISFKNLLYFLLFNASKKKTSCTIDEQPSSLSQWLRALWERQRMAGIHRRSLPPKCC